MIKIINKVIENARNDSVSSKKDNELGITLIVLVITIIILLIIAGITIMSLTRSGLLDKTKFAEKEFKNAENIENNTLSDYQNQIGKYTNIAGNRENLDELSFSNYRMCALIPNMTSANTPSGIVESNDYYTGRDPFHAFTENVPNANTGMDYWFSMYNNSWLSYTWKNEVLIGKVEFYKKMQNEFKIQYLDNGEWKDIATTPRTNGNDGFEKITLYFPNIVKTKTIRFYCTAVDGESVTTGCALGNIRAYGIERVK